jgi:hypothetical protein
MVGVGKEKETGVRPCMGASGGVCSPGDCRSRLEHRLLTSDYARRGPVRRCRPKTISEIPVRTLSRVRYKEGGIAAVAIAKSLCLYLAKSAFPLFLPLTQSSAFPLSLPLSQPQTSSPYCPSPPRSGVMTLPPKVYTFLCGCFAA